MLRLAVFWLPLALLGVLSGSYVLACFDWVSAPGRSLTIQLPTRSGIVTLKAETYALDLNRGVLNARGVTLFEPSGAKIASAEILFLQLPWLGGDDAIHVKARNADLLIERDEKGRFRFEEFLPEKTREPSTTSFTLEFENTQATLLDHVGGEAWSRRWRSKSLKIDGVGDGISASGDLQQPVLGGSLSGTIRSDSNTGITVNLTVKDLDIAPYFGRFLRGLEAKDYPEMASLSVRECVVNGSIRVAAGAKKPVSIAGVGDIRGSDFAYKQYAFQRAEFKGVWTGLGANGEWLVEQSGARATAKGFADWTGPVRLGGNVTISAPRLGALPGWIRDFLPMELELRSGEYKGWLAYEPGIGLVADGDLRATEASWKSEKLADPSLRLYGSRAKVVASLQSGSWRGNEVSGAISKSGNQGVLTGFLLAPNVDLSKIGRIVGLKHMSGTSIVSAVIGGTFDKPLASIRAKGSATYLDEKSRSYSLKDYQALANIEGHTVSLNQFAGSVAGGRLYGSGKVDLETHKLDLGLFLAGADLSAIDSRFAGSGAGQAVVKGTWDDPRARGKIELYGLKYEDSEFPFVAANLSATKHLVEALDLRAARSSARIRGGGKWNLESDELSGTFTAEGIELSELFGESFAGVVSVPEFTLSGTTKHPLADFRVSAQELVAFGAKMDTGEARGRLDGNTVLVDTATFSTDGGKLAGSGKFDLDTESGNLTATATNLDLMRVLPALPGQTLLGGLAGGKVEASFVKNELLSLTAMGDVDALTVNPTLLGSGSWQAEYNNGVWSGSTQVGQIERYLEASKLTFDPAKDTMDGNLIAYGMPIKDIYLALRPYFAGGETRKLPPVFEISPSVLEKLDALEGSLDALVSIHGDPHNPDVTIETAAARNLTVFGTKSGDLTLSATRKREVWDLTKFEWKNGPAKMDVTGTIAEHGDISLDGNLDNVSTTWMETFLPGAVNLQGELRKLSFLVSGPTNDPTVQASLLATLFEARPTPEKIAAGAADVTPKEQPAERDTRLVVSLDDVTLSNSGARMAGVFSYLGFKGSLRGTLPFKFPFSSPSDEPVSMVLDLNDRPLKDLHDLIPNLDPARTDGNIGGRITVSGTMNDPKVDGLVASKNAKLGLRGTHTSLVNMDLNASMANDAVLLKVKGESSTGGNVDGDLRLALSDVKSEMRDLFQFAAGLISSPPNNALSGSIKLAGFHLSEGGGAAEGRIETSAQGEVAIGGTLREPTLSTNLPIELAGVNARAPEEFASTGTRYAGAINPKFAIDFRMGDRDRPARFAASNANFEVHGDGRLSGSLSEPQLAANLTVANGAIRLPNARVQIESGGLARFRYALDNEAISSARLDIDLQGKTNLTATAINGIVERYGVNLHITGDLLGEGAMHISALSDPPGLSEDRILALLGQGGVFEAAGSQGPNIEFQRQFQSAVTGIAVPMLLDPFTQRLARDLGLEYLSLEYNAYEGASITVGKSLWRGIAIQYRRQVSDPLEGKTRFEFKLTYRPFRKPGFLGNLYFSLGSDEIRPWKISLEFGVRF